MSCLSIQWQRLYLSTLWPRSRLINLCVWVEIALAKLVTENFVINLNGRWTDLVLCEKKICLFEREMVKKWRNRTISTMAKVERANIRTPKKANSTMYHLEFFFGRISDSDQWCTGKLKIKLSRWRKEMYHFGWVSVCTSFSSLLQTYLFSSVQSTKQISKIKIKIFFNGSHLKGNKPFLM